MNQRPDESNEFSSVKEETRPGPLIDMSVEILKAISIMDKVFPSIDEIFYCVKKNLVQKRELIVYKMILDMYEALYNNCMPHQEETRMYQKEDLDKVSKVLIPCCIKFYKRLDKREVEGLVSKMKEIKAKVKYYVF